MLEVKNLTVRYGGMEAAENISFSVLPGQWLMIVGPNGAGKTTLLNAVAQNVPYSGSVLLDGQDVRSIKARERAKNMGLLSQNHFVGYDFTVEEIIRLGRYAHAPRMFSGKADEGAGKIEEAIEKTGLRHCLGQSVLTLSGGELQRAFLAQLFAQDPKLLLLDEPTNHLDLLYQKQIFSLIDDWRKEENRAVVSVVHDLSLAKAYGSHVLLMDRGKAAALGNVEAVLSPDSLNRVYSMDVYAWMQDMYSRWLE